MKGCSTAVSKIISEAANRYIHGGEGTAQEAAAATGFAIYRTQEMAENVLWILEQEASYGCSRIFLSAHNGHVEQNGSYGPQSKVMGNLLADAVGEDRYYAIGTDFYKAKVNLPRRDRSRMTHTFYSYDSMATQCSWERSA